METAKSVDLAVLCWRWAIFPVRRQTSIVASAELNFCVRNGNRWTLCGNITNFVRYSRTICISNELSSRFVAKQVFSPQQSLTSVFGMGTGGPSAIISLIFLLTSKRNKGEIETETQTIWTLIELSVLKEVQALGLLVSVNWMHYCTYISDLSNS